MLKTIGTLFRDYKPLTFFSIIALIFAVIGMIFFVPVLIDYAQTGMVDRFPTLFVACMLFIVAVLMYVTGLLLHVINKKHRQLYELYLNTIK